MSNQKFNAKSCCHTGHESDNTTESQCGAQKCKDCRCQNKVSKSTSQKMQLLVQSEMQAKIYIKTAFDKQALSDSLPSNTWPDYHGLLPRYLQDALKRAAHSYPDQPFSRLCEIEHVMQMARSEFPKGFKHEDTAQQ